MKAFKSLTYFWVVCFHSLSKTHDALSTRRRVACSRPFVIRGSADVQTPIGCVLGGVEWLVSRLLPWNGADSTAGLRVGELWPGMQMEPKIQGNMFFDH
jgi:hypothetical protein